MCADSGDFRGVHRVLLADDDRQEHQRRGGPEDPQHPRLRPHLLDHVHQSHHLRRHELRVPPGNGNNKRKRLGIGLEALFCPPFTGVSLAPRLRISLHAPFCLVFSRKSLVPTRLVLTSRTVL